LRFHANLDRLERHFNGRLRVVQLDFRRDFDRYRLTPAVRALLKAQGKACLPILMLAEAVIVSGVYPEWQELLPAVEQGLANAAAPVTQECGN